ncbi:riboflavin biosynthesis protein RibF [Roseivivax halodurans JCM 10272]|uniref:Riboflavin biosynthesis protein n=1 Tax=Roseivivax halodurans JCM 10272 TaxID=1449350 RepID=X7EJT1_9RHOB|nr:bifunctional riboflavin kinase/FAD synthetase [Roseivivax halodurans]ETX15401.1 riboflavin biosynthesis protein RibF [Roseivivax halodurans JCM 10272]
MRILRDPRAVPEEARGATAAIGNFDGVHLGHRAVIETARAAAPDAPLGVVTFEPHPREVFRPDDPPFRLTGPETRANRLRKLGVDWLFEMPFEMIRPLSPEAFAREILGEGLGLSHAVTGPDFRFGKDRAGTVQDLGRFGQLFGFGTTEAPVTEASGLRISSTAIRTAISEGRPRDAATLLGHWHRIDGPVLHGEKRGRDLGYPTANMSIEGLHPPRFGVYAVKVDVLTGPHAGTWDGAASVGVRPMFGENQANIETYLFEFEGDVYDTHLSVALVEFLRPEERFDGVETLIAQMGEDCARARAILSETA